MRILDLDQAVTKQNAQKKVIARCLTVTLSRIDGHLGIVVSCVIIDIGVLSSNFLQLIFMCDTQV
jgi:hypothetical protein